MGFRWISYRPIVSEFFDVDGLVVFDDRMVLVDFDDRMVCCYGSTDLVDFDYMMVWCDDALCLCLKVVS